MRKLIVLTGFITCYLTSFAQGNHDLIKKFWADFLDRSMNNAVVGYSFVLYRNDTMLVDISKGYAVREKKIPMTSDTRIQIASCSKPVTATALLHELARKHISVDTPVTAILSKRFKSFGKGVDSITIRHLLTHTSGYNFGYLENPLYENAEKLLASNVPNQVGGRSQYSNINTALARIILEQLSEQQYEDYVREKLLSKVGANKMRLEADSNEVAYSYKYIDDSLKGTPIHDDFRNEGAAYGWYATANEMARFLYGVSNHLFLSPEATDEMLRKGLGWGATPLHFDTVYSHDGQWVIDNHVGIRSGIMLLPGNYSAVLLLNTNAPVFPGDVLRRGFSELMPRVSRERDAKFSYLHVDMPSQADRILYTTNGALPGLNSAVYKRSIKVAAPGIVVVQGFRGNKIVTLPRIYQVK